MLFTLILGGLAGALVPWAEPRVTQAMRRTIGDGRMPDAPGRRLAAFAVTLFVAAVLVELLDAADSPVLLVLGGAVGAFWREIRDIVQG